MQAYKFLKIIGKALGKFISMILALAVLISLFAQVFPEPVSNVTEYVYQKTRLDEPNLIFESVYVDGGYDDVISNCSPFYYEAAKLNLKYQKFIADNPMHEVVFNLRNNNKITNSDIVVKNIKVSTIDKRDNLIKQVEEIECGAAGSYKVYSVNSDEFKETINQGEGIVTANPTASWGSEAFDYVVLNQDFPQDSIKLNIPMKAYGIIGIKIIIDAEYRNKHYSYSMDPIYIANSPEAERIINAMENQLQTTSNK